MAKIKIIEKIEGDGSLESIFFDSEDVLTVSTKFVAPKEKDEEDIYAETDTISFTLSGMEEMTYGERPALYQIADEGELIVKTTDVRVFYQAYTECLDPGFIPKEKPAEEDKDKQK